MTSRLQDAVKNTAAPSELEARIRNAIRRSNEPGARHGWRAWSAMAAALVITVLAIGYERGHWRLTSASRESYIASISSHVGGVMRTALGDHVNCAVFRKYPKNPPPVEEFVKELGPAYKDLVPAMTSSIPPGYRIVLAHHCGYHGRPFVHVIMRKGSAVVSLVIGRRGDGEVLQVDRATAQRFQIAAFETTGHLVYLISDMAPQANQAVMTAVAAPVRAVLRRVEDVEQPGW